MNISRKNSKKRSRKLKKIAKRLAAYSAAAAATVVAAQRTANAADQSYNIVPDITVGPAHVHGVVFNMLAGTASTTVIDTGFGGPGSMRMIGFYTGYANPYLYTPAFSANGAFVVTAETNAARLGPSALIDGNQLFGFNPAYASIGNYVNLGNWSVGQRGFAGIRFDIGAETHYGWVDITRAAANEVTLHAFGYNDAPGAASHVPEPTSLLLLAAGAAGLPLWRKKKSGETA